MFYTGMRTIKTVLKEEHCFVRLLAGLTNMCNFDACMSFYVCDTCTCMHTIS